MELFFLKVSIMLVPALMAITCHEVSHGYIADKFGDSTARSLGRLTLNPLKHLDLFGTLMIFIVGIGWAKPVPVNFNNLRRPKTDMIWVAAAGPITNFTLACVSAFAMRLLVAATEGVPDGSMLAAIIDPTALMLAFSISGVVLKYCIENTIRLTITIPSRNLSKTTDPNASLPVTILFFLR